MDELSFSRNRDGITQCKRMVPNWRMVSSSVSDSSSSSVYESEDESDGKSNVALLDDLFLDPYDEICSSTKAPSVSSFEGTQSGMEFQLIRTKQTKRGSFVATVEIQKPEAFGANAAAMHGRNRNSKNRRNQLFEKRLYKYPAAIAPSVPIVPSSYSRNGTKVESKQTSLFCASLDDSAPKTELEQAVLVDVITNHLLVTASTFGKKPNGVDGTKNDLMNESQTVMIDTLVSLFEKVSYRSNEIIFNEGDETGYLYVLYRGEVIIRCSLNHDEMKVEDSAMSYREQQNYEKIDDDQEKYKLLGELELLTNSPRYRYTAKATASDDSSTVLFRLSARDFQTYFLPQQIMLSSTLVEEYSNEDDRLLQALKEALPTELAMYFFPNENDSDESRQEEHNKLWKRLLSERKICNFRAGDVLVHRNKAIHGLVLITKGLVRSTENTAGGRAYEDLMIGPGKARTSFGWQSVLKNIGRLIESDGTAEIPKHGNTTMTGTIRAETDGQAIVISKQAFEMVFCHGHCFNTYKVNESDHLRGRYGRHTRDSRSLLMDVEDLRWRQWKRSQLQQIMVFKDSGLDSTQISGLIDLMHPVEYNLEEKILKAGQKADAAMYFVREGSVRLELNQGKNIQIIEQGGYFGEKSMLLDQNKTNSAKHHQKRSVISATSATPSTKLDVLYLEECREVVNTSTLGLGKTVTVNSLDKSVKWSALKRHKLIGSGSFGQVWLVSTSSSESDADGNDNKDAADITKAKSAADITKAKSHRRHCRRFYALKVQPKYAVLQSGDADRLIAEKNVMASLCSPFVMRLFNTFQDDYRLYMITSLLSGGELESIIPEQGFSEVKARFYAACILEGLTYMHRRHIIHRDVKPENVLLNARGYPVLIDLGFAKYVPEKTYTFCGSPLYMAPEIILYKGHNKGVDHWSWAVLVYRLVTGEFPFYKKGMDEMAVYKRICKGSFQVSGRMSIDFRTLMIAVLYPDATQRLGSRANGWKDIFSAAWFTNSSLDLAKLRKQKCPAPIMPDGKNEPFRADCNETMDVGSFIHQSSDDFEDLFHDSVCGKIADNQQHFFSSFGSYVSNSLSDLATIS